MSTDVNTGKDIMHRPFEWPTTHCTPRDIIESLCQSVGIGLFAVPSIEIGDALYSYLIKKPGWYSPDSTPLCILTRLLPLVVSQIDYDVTSSILAGRVAVYLRYEQLGDMSFSGLAVDTPYSNDVCDYVRRHGAIIDQSIMPWMDYYHLQYGSYITHAQKIKIHTPLEPKQYTYMRMAIALRDFGDTIDDVLNSYRQMALAAYAMATPILTTCGLKTNKLASCYLVAVDDEKDVASVHLIGTLLKQGCGVGVDLSRCSARGGTIGRYLSALDSTCSLLHRRQGVRTAVVTVYLPDHHKGIYELLRSKDTYNAEKWDCVSIALVMHDDLYERALTPDRKWSLFSPEDVPLLASLAGKEYTEAYLSYEADTSISRQEVSAAELLAFIGTTYYKHSMPFILNHGPTNRRNNQSHLGVISQSNLCTEIVEYTDRNTLAACMLSSINVSAVFNPTMPGGIDYCRLVTLAKRLCKMLDRCITITNYPTDVDSTRFQPHCNDRPLAIGICGLFDLSAMLRIPMNSHQMIAVARSIMQHVYYGAIDGSIELAASQGPYESYWRSPIGQRGMLQYDYMTSLEDDHGSLDWAGLKRRLAMTGMRNAMVTGQPPTVTSSFIIGVSESIDAIPGNVYIKKTSAGDISVFNEHLYHDLRRVGVPISVLTKIDDTGSIQAIEAIPPEIRALYLTDAELPLWRKRDFVSAIQPYVDQAISFTITIDEARYDKPVLAVCEHIIDSYRRGIKTLYYCRHGTRKTITLNLRGMQNAIACNDHDCCQ